MSREKTLLKNTLIMMLGTFLPRIINLFTTPIITGSISTENFGVVELISNTILYFIVPICTLQMEQALFRFLVDSKDKTDKKKTLTNGYAVIFVMMIIGALIATFVPVSGFGGVYKLLLIFYIIVEILATLSRFVLRGFSKYKEYSILAGLVVIVNFACVAFNLLYLKMDMQGVILALTIADVAGFIYVLVVCNIFSYINIKYFDIEYVKEMLRYALPFIPNQLSWYINQMSDKWILTWFLGAGANGIYSMALKIPSIVNILYPAFNLAWTDSATRSVNDKDSGSYYNSMFKMLFCIVSAGSALLLGISPILFMILCRNPNMYVALNYLPILVIATYFYCFSQFFGSIYVAIKRTKNMSVTTTIAAMINIIINLLFIKNFGVIVACLSTLAANSFMAGYRYYDLNKNHYHLRISRRIIILTIALFVVMGYLTISGDKILMLLNIVLACGYAYFVAGDIFINMIKSLLKRRT